MFDSIQVKVLAGTLRQIDPLDRAAAIEAALAKIAADERREIAGLLRRIDPSDRSAAIEGAMAKIAADETVLAG